VRKPDDPSLPLVPEIILTILQYIPLIAKQYATFSEVCIPFYLAARPHLKENIDFTNYDPTVHVWEFDSFTQEQWKMMTLTKWPNIRT
jgi:hypothetical protein